MESNHCLTLTGRLGHHVPAGTADDSLIAPFIGRLSSTELCFDCDYPVTSGTYFGRSGF